MADDVKQIASRIEHSLLRVDCTGEQIIRLCAEAREYGFAGVCIPPVYVRTAMQELAGSPFKVVTVISFPYGYQTLEVKKSEAQNAIYDGADELDMVINLAALRSGQWDVLERELKHMTVLCRGRSTPLKVIIESAMLTDEELDRICHLCATYQPAYVKTSTGINAGGATVEAVRKMRSLLPDTIKIKASGGIKTADSALNLIKAGADRIGTSSGISIMKELA